MSSSYYHALRSWQNNPQLQKDDTLVIFGEVFDRGYVNGLIDEARKVGAQVIYSTVGRRDAEQNLRPLTEQELTDKNQSPLINIPLEAGFDMEPSSDGIRPIDQLKDYGLTGWENAKLDWGRIEDSRQKGIARFRQSTTLFLKEVEKYLKPGRRLLIAHTMAGGFPRAKVVMPIANRVFKGSGPRYLSSQMFWESEIGKLCDLSFKEVTAQTMQHLLDLSGDLRNKISKSGGQVAYIAFGYHGNEVLTGDKYSWYSYSPYLQGFAKVELEKICQKAKSNGITATTYNVPEILTNSSSIFLGIEVVLYPLLRALQKEGAQSSVTKQTLAKCESLLKEPFRYADIDQLTQDYLNDPKVRQYPKFEGWPQHNDPEQMEKMIKASQLIIEMHKNPKELLTAELSELIFRACGNIMIRTAFQPEQPVMWIGHQSIAKATLEGS